MTKPAPSYQRLQNSCRPNRSSHLRNPGRKRPARKNDPIKNLLYFAYGSNLHVPQLRGRAPSAKPIGIGRLANHRLAFTRQSHRWSGLAADVLPHTGSTVFGAVISVSPGDLDGLDRSEFLGVGYQRIGVSPQLVATGRPVRAFTYEVIDKHPEGRPPAKYLDTMLAGARDVGLPSHWLTFLESFA